MRPVELVKEGRLESQPCLFSEAANPSDVCQVCLGETTKIFFRLAFPCGRKDPVCLLNSPILSI